MTHEEQLRKLKNIMAQFVGFTGIKLPDDVIAKLKELSEKETDPMPKVIYETMFRNQELAVKLNRPSCQDTGVLQFWVKCGTQFPFIDDLEVLLKEAVVQATFDTPLRHNSVQTRMSARAHPQSGGILFPTLTSARSTPTWQAAAAPFPAMRLF